MNFKLDAAKMTTSIRPVKTILQFQWKSVNGQSKKELAKWLSKELETLGPTYIKMGQFISTRRDIFGKEFSDEFTNLRDNVYPLTQAELFTSISALKDANAIASISREPLASASIAQVHKALLKRNTNKNSSQDKKDQRVVVKIKRPNIENDIRTNIKFLVFTLSVLNSLDLIENAVDSIDLLRDFESSILKEIDFKNEAAQISLFRTIYKDNKSFYIPKVYRKYSNNDIIVMEYVPSQPISSFKGNRKELARSILQSFIEQLIQTGTIHGDPHSGNMGLMPDGRVVLYDFGNVVHISFQDRQYLKELIYYLLVSNKSAIITTLKRLQIRITNESDINRYIDAYIDYMKTLDINKIQTLMVNGDGNVKMPFKLTGEFFRLLRVFSILEGVCKELDPNFNYFDVLQNYVSDILFDQEFIIYKTQADFNTLVGASASSTELNSVTVDAASGFKNVNYALVMNAILIVMMLFKG